MENLLEYVRSPIPYGRLARQDHTEVSLTDLASERAVLLLFVPSASPGCETALALLPRWRRLLSAVRVVPVTGEAAQHASPSKRPADMHVDNDKHVALLFGASYTTATAVLLGADGLLAGGPVTGTDAIAQFVDDIAIAISRPALADASEPDARGSASAVADRRVVGVLTPTFNRPDLARSVVLQMNNQQRRPDYLAIHQNGQPESYEWSIADINTDIHIEWIHTPTPTPQDQWYETPLRILIDHGCDVFFWCDHDDLYFANHLQNGMAVLEQGYDFSYNDQSGLLMLNKSGYTYEAAKHFTAHEGGHSSSMCFNRRFAEALADDLSANGGRLYFSDQVVHRVTKPRFRAHVNSSEVSTVYVCHATTVSSSHWLGE